MDLHISALQSLCRLCGNRAKKKYDKRPAKLCNNYTQDILTIYGVDIRKDQSDIHPSCYRRIINTKRTENDESYVVISTDHIDCMWIVSVSIIDNCARTSICS